MSNTMTEPRELCPKCGSAVFGILRDMTSRRVCKCSHNWDAPEKKYISPHLLVHKELWNQVSERYDKLKSDYDALKQLSDAFYLKQVQLENQNEELKLHIAGRSEKYKIAMDKGVDVLSAEIKALKSKLEKAESVISFYASEDTWINKEFDEKNNLIGWTQKKPNDVSIFPYSIGNSNGNFHCLGRRAREYMKGEG